MKTVSFFHKETGALHGNQLICSDDAVVALNTPPDHIAVDGHYNCLSQRVDVPMPPELVDDINQYGCTVGKRIVHRVIDYVPPSPSTEHEWNPETKRWVLNLATVAEEQKRAAATARIAQLEASQHTWIRRHVLGDNTALAHLQEIDDEVAVLTGEL